LNPAMVTNKSTKVEIKQAQNKRVCFFILGEAVISFVDFQSGAWSGYSILPWLQK